MIGLSLSDIPEAAWNHALELLLAVAVLLLKRAATKRKIVADVAGSSVRHMTDAIEQFGQTQDQQQAAVVEKLKDLIASVTAGKPEGTVISKSAQFSDPKKADPQ